MKPRNDRQRKIVALSATLPPLTPAQHLWAANHCFSHHAFLCKGFAWCSACGREFKSQEPPLGATLEKVAVRCPSCGARLTYKVSRKQRQDEKSYFQTVTTCRGYQVVRSFIVSRCARKGYDTHTDIREAVQNWISPDGHEEVIARPVNYIPTGCYDAWNFSKPMELRDQRARHSDYMEYQDKYTVPATWTYPSRSVLPILKRNGYTGRCYTLPQSELIKLLLTDPEAEVLVKAGQFSLLALKWRRGIRPWRMPYAHAIRIARRNGYIVRDASMWMDYLEMLDYFHLDTHNAHYVCPRNLKAEHDRLLRRKQRIEAAEEDERKRKEAAKWENDYKASKGKYFGICFGNEHLTITVIQSVAEMAEEGKVMHHCVYNAGYHKRPDSLILSARDKDGNRIETIELNLRTLKVVQSRAKCNGQSPLHAEILDLVNKHAHLFRLPAA